MGSDLLQYLDFIILTVHSFRKYKLLKWSKFRNEKASRIDIIMGLCIKCNILYIKTKAMNV